MVEATPVLDCGMTSHSDYGAQDCPLTPSDIIIIIVIMFYFRLYKTVSEILPIWHPKRLVTLSNLYCAV